MAFSEMNAREKTIVAVLGVIILIALIGIGVLVARLVGGGKAGEEAVLTVVPTAAEQAEQAAPEATITLVAAPAPEQAAEMTPAPVSDRPVVVVREQSPGPMLPALLTNYPLYAGRVYRLEVTAIDGSSLAVQGSWSQAAASAGGEVQTTLPEFFDGPTPFVVDLAAPVAEPTSWSVSISAAPKNLLGESPLLVITLYDVTGSQ